MTTKAAVQIAIDQRTASLVAAVGPTSVIYGNEDKPELSKGTAGFVKQKVLFLSDSQYDLGRPQAARTRGSVVFTVHTRKGIGTAESTTLIDRVVKSFRGTQFAGVTFLNSRILNSGETENWMIVGIDIPFYFHEL